MPEGPMNRFRLNGVAIVLVFLPLIASRAQSTQAAPHGPSSTSASTAASAQPAQLVEFLSRTISWYRQLTVEQQLSSEPSDYTYIQENRRVADQVIQLAFDYARSQA